MTTSDIRPIATLLFSLFPDADLAVIGSAVEKFTTAGDIDLLFFEESDFKRACEKLKVKYNGWNTTQIVEGTSIRVHVRRANLAAGIVPGLPKKVQLLTDSKYPSPMQYPYAILLRNGDIRNPSKAFQKGTR